MIMDIVKFYSLRAYGFDGFEWVFIVGGKDLYTTYFLGVFEYNFCWIGCLGILSSEHCCCCWSWLFVRL